MSRTRVIRMAAVIEKTGLSRSSIYEKLNPASARYDDTFPKPVKLSVKAIGWVEESVDIWIHSR